MLLCGEPWFALQVFPRHEAKVDLTLGRRGYDHFLPTCRVSRKWSDRVKVIEQPLFPGYVFCKRQNSLMDFVRGTPGIIRIVSIRGKPCAVADEEIEALRRVVQAKRDTGPVPYLCSGQRVRVVAGPLSGITGIITQFKKRDRLVLSVDLIMKSMSVEIDRSEVALLDCT